MSATILPFRRKPKSPPSRAHDVPDVQLVTLESMSTHERILAVDESGAARKLCISVEEFRAQCPFDPIEGTDGLYYSVDDVAAEMVRRNIPVGTICKGAS